MDEASAGEYIVCFDPLDGSSNIDAGVSIGSIFGIYKRTETGPATAEEALRGYGRALEQLLLSGTVGLGAYFPLCLTSPAAASGAAASGAHGKDGAAMVAEVAGGPPPAAASLHAKLVARGAPPPFLISSSPEAASLAASLLTNRAADWDEAVEKQPLICIVRMVFKVSVFSQKPFVQA